MGYIMSTEENITVIELPYTESVSCYLEKKGKYLWSFTFVKDGATVLFKGNILNPDQDKLIESITDNMEDYFSSYGISGLNAAVDKILDVIENPSNYTWQSKEDIDILNKLPTDVGEIKEDKENKKIEINYYLNTIFIQFVRLLFIFYFVIFY